MEDWKFNHYVLMICTLCFFLAGKIAYERGVDGLGFCIVGFLIFAFITILNYVCNYSVK